MSAWVWDAFHRETPNQLLLFRRRVRSAGGALAGGTVAVAARGSWRMWVDGALVAHHDLQSPYPGAESVAVDLDDRLPDGPDVTIVIGVYLLGIGTHHQQRSLGGLWVTGSLRTTDGDRIPLDTGSDVGWETHVPASWGQTSAQMVWSAGYREQSDRTVDAVDRTAGAGDGWAAAVAYPDGDRPVPVHRATASRQLDLPGRRPPAGRGSVWRCALPHQVVGYVTVVVDADHPTDVKVRYGEAVDADGLPTATRQGITAVDRVRVPAGRTRHGFWHRRTFRALAVVADDPDTTIVGVDVRTVTAARPSRHFTTEVDRLRRMHEVSVATVQAGLQDLYEDCPLREGGHYVADARIQAAFDLATTGVAETAARSLHVFAAGQDPDGMLPALWPSGTRHRIPDFALQWVQYLDEVVRFTDDDGLLAALWPTLQRVLEWADARWDRRAGHVDADEPGWWVFVDWAEFTPEARQAALDAQYAVTLAAAERLADRYDDRAAAASRADQLDAVLASLGRVGHPHAAAVLLCGLPARRARAAVAPGALDGFCPETGYFAFTVARAHIVLGDPAAAARLVERYWGGMLDAGAGTWWERWSPVREVTEATEASLCHPWSAGPIVLLPMLALGVDPFAIEERDSRFPPVDLGGAVSATLHTPWRTVWTVPDG